MLILIMTAATLNGIYMIQVSFPHPSSRDVNYVFSLVVNVVLTSTFPLRYQSNIEKEI